MPKHANLTISALETTPRTLGTRSVTPPMNHPRKTPKALRRVSWISRIPPRVVLSAVIVLALTAAMIARPELASALAPILLPAVGLHALSPRNDPPGDDPPR